MEDVVLTGLDQAIASFRRGSYGRADKRPTAEEIRNLRSASGLNRQEFCDWIGISLDTLKSWEANRRQPGKAASRLLTIYKQSLEKVD